MSKLIKLSQDRSVNRRLVHLNIDCDETGAVRAQAVFPGGPDSRIPSHFFLMELLKLADSLGERLPVPHDETAIPKGQVFS